MKVKIREFRFVDIPKKVEWINDPANNRFLHYDLPMTYERTCQWFEEKNNRIRRDFLIVADEVPVGVIGLLDIDWAESRAGYYITVGEPGYRRKGVAMEATRLMLNYAFSELNLRRIYLNVDADNLAACGLYEKCGFICEGIFPRAIERRGELIDRKQYAITKGT